MAKVDVKTVGREVDLNGAVPLNPLGTLDERPSDRRILIVADKRGIPQQQIRVGYRGSSRQVRGPDDGEMLG